MLETPQRMKKIHIGRVGGTSYSFVQIRRNGRNHQLKIHQLVASAFQEEKKKVITEDRDRKRTEMDARLASMGLLQG